MKSKPYMTQAVSPVEGRQVKKVPFKVPLAGDVQRKFILKQL